MVPLPAPPGADPRRTVAWRAKPSGGASSQSLPVAEFWVAGSTHIVYTRPVIYASLPGDPSCPPRQPAAPTLVRVSPARRGSRSARPRCASRVSWKKLLPAREPDSGASFQGSRCRRRNCSGPRRTPSQSRSSSTGSWSAYRTWAPLPAGPEVTALSDSPPRSRRKTSASRRPSPTPPNSRQMTPRRTSRVFWKKLLPARGSGFTPRPRASRRAPHVAPHPPPPTHTPLSKLSRALRSGTVRHCLPTGRPA